MNLDFEPHPNHCVDVGFGAQSDKTPSEMTAAVKKKRPIAILPKIPIEVRWSKAVLISKSREKEKSKT